MSGCELADYVHLMSLVHEDGVPRMRAPGQPDLRVLFVPKGHYDILDTWHVGGLRGLRSRRRRGRRVRARGRHICRPSVAGHSPLAQLPIIPVMTVALAPSSWAWHAQRLPSLARYYAPRCPSIQAPRSASARVCSPTSRRIARRSPPPGVTSTPAWRPWDNVRNHLPTVEDRATLYSAGLRAPAIARAGVMAMHAAAGTPALYSDCPLERSMRDLHTMEQHIAAQPLWLEDAGRVLVGQEPTNPLFMI